MSEQPTLLELLRKELEAARRLLNEIDAGRSAMPPVKGVNSPPLPLSVQRKRQAKVVANLERKVRRAEGRS